MQVLDEGIAECRRQIQEELERYLMDKTTPTKPEDAAVETSTPRSNGMTEEQIQYMLSALGRRKNDPGYLQRGEAGVAEYRRLLREELERDLAAEGK